MPIDIDGLLARNESLKAQKQQWLPLYQVLAQYILQRKQYFTRDLGNGGGPFLTNKVYDSTAIHASHMMASSILGQIWPNPFESFEFVPQIAQDEEAFSDAWDMMTTVNQVMPASLSAAEAGVMSSFHEGVHDAGIFGTGALAVLENKNSYTVPLRVKALDAKVMSFAEDDAGQVDTVYWEKSFTVAQVVKRYGYENCSDKVQKAYDNPKRWDEKVTVLQVIEPRRERNPLLMGVLDMPFSSIHIEVDTKHLLEESGYQEMPIIVFRFWKTVGEVPGRSPAMDALADIRALNKLVEMFEKAGEMMLDPPKMVSTEDVVGSGKVPWGPGVFIPTHTSGRLGSDRPPIEPILNVSNPGWAQQRITELQQNISQYFMLDRLSDLNNRSRQTLGEANIRNELRMFMIGPHLVRLLIEMVTPFLDRSFNILLERGFFGVVRGSLQDLQMQAQGLQPKYISEDFINQRMGGLKGYRINYISPAARLMKLEEAQGLEKLTQYTMAVSQFDPSVLKVQNFQESVRIMQRLAGASQKAINSPAQVQQAMEAEAQQAAEMQDMQMAQAGAAAFKDAATGVKNLGSNATARSA